jgi:hypothetical protein
MRRRNGPNPPSRSRPRRGRIAAETVTDRHTQGPPVTPGAVASCPEGLALSLTGTERLPASIGRITFSPGLNGREESWGSSISTTN